MKSAFTKVLRFFYHLLTHILAVVCDCRIENRSNDEAQEKSNCHKEEE